LQPRSCSVLRFASFLPCYSSLPALPTLSTSFTYLQPANVSSHRALPIFEQIFAKQSERGHAPGVRLVTIWFGTFGKLRPC
jgi:hypothetical protein